MTVQQIKSKKRIADHGEVFTSEREVNAMLDLVKQETDRIESKFLEPACGTGNFLAEILRRKLSVVEKRYKRNQLEFEKNSITAISSVYGIDLLEDNVLECRDRLFNIFNNMYIKIFKKKAKEKIVVVAKFILEKNIIAGDALSLQTVGANPKPITFSEWSSLPGSSIKRKDYYFENLSRENNSDDLFVKNSFHKNDKGEEGFIPHPIKTYPKVHFLEVANA